MIQFYALLILGILLVGFTAYDFFYTTLSFKGAGPMTKVVTDVTSSTFLFLNRYARNRVLLSFSGVTHILILTCFWIGLLWLGLFLILSGSDTSIVHSTSNEAANWVNKLYFSGYVLSTLGNGDFKPSSGGWQMIVAFFSFSGFIFISTTISYLINLGSAVLHKRTLSLFISNLGDSAQEIVTHCYTDGSFDRLVKLIPVLQEKINKLNQNHYAYPLSHYFTSTSVNDSLPINLFNLDEALTIIKYHIEKKPFVEDDIRPLRNAIRDFLNTIQANFVTQFQHEKDLMPDRNKLEESGLSLTKPPDLNDEETAKIEERRFLFYGFLKSTGWDLDAIHLDHIKNPGSNNEKYGY